MVNQCNVLGLIVLTVVFFGNSSPSYAQKASGHGQVTFEGAFSTYAFTAVKLKSGNVVGQVQARNETTGAYIHARVDCLVVNQKGTQAALLGIVTQSGPEAVAPPVGLAFLLLVEDTGAGANSPPDRLSLVGFAPPYMTPDLTQGSFEPLPGYVSTVELFCGLAEGGLFFPIEANPFLPIMPNQNGNIQVNK